MVILESQTHQRAIQKLRKKKAYSSIDDDLQEFFDNHEFDEIWEMRFFLRGNGGVRLLKLRIKNRNQTRGTSAGYRLIARCQSDNKEVCLLYVYPKIGPHAQINIDDNFEVKLLKKYKEQLLDNSLVYSELNQAENEKV